MKPGAEEAAKRIEAIWQGAEDRVMKDIIRRIKKTGKITSTADYQINNTLIWENQQKS